MASFTLLDKFHFSLDGVSKCLASEGSMCRWFSLKQKKWRNYYKHDTRERTVKENWEGEQVTLIWIRFTDYENYNYLTIIPRGRMGYWLRGHEDENIYPQTP